MAAPEENECQGEPWPPDDLSHPSAATVPAASHGAAVSDNPSPAARLYRHALESIFAFLDLREAATALQVSRGWMAAVQSMASLQLALKKPSAPICEVAASAMSRHVASLGSESTCVSLTADSLFALARHMAHLRELVLQLHPTLPHPFDDAATSLLPQLPSLTELIGWTMCSRFDFLRRLPNLVELVLAFRPGTRGAGRAQALLDGLRPCAGITSLHMHLAADLTAHLSELLPHLPRLQTLVVSALDIASLSFLGQGTVTRSLRSLRLFRCKRLPLTELQHMHALHSLKDLSVDCSFTTPLDAHGQSLYTPPSALLPQLESFSYSAPYT